ncbi:Shiga-like toxin beta subunit [Lysobacter sp. TAF61]|uniref:Shiga-like toxin beta subunit n=1 Tax=Lysobacter sp. TAF61 TaxID=3233072 RepID=UPI003F962537
MKKILATLILCLPLVAVAATPQCRKGKIDAVKYNSNNSMTVTVSGIELYTDRQALQPYLFGAYLTGTVITIYTTACHFGGGFAEVTFQ